jgi:hypothetical protein
MVGSSPIERLKRTKLLTAAGSSLQKESLPLFSALLYTFFCQTVCLLIDR